MTAWNPKRPAYMLRTCTAEMRPTGSQADRSFVWPRPDDDIGHGPGIAVAPDWSPIAKCGQGLHGLLHGEGNADMLSWDDTAIWMIVEVDLDEVVDLDRKVKVPSGRVIYAGDRAICGAKLSALCPGRTVIAGTATAGDFGTAKAGDGGTATAGECGIATAGECGTATAGECGTATAGNRGTAKAGNRGTAKAGDFGTATAGDGGTATAGYGGTATAGYGGTATAGYGGTATAGDFGTATAGDFGTATAGECGMISIEYWCPKRARYRRAIAEVGKNGIKPTTAYVIDVRDGVAVFVRKDGQS